MSARLPWRRIAMAGSRDAGNVKFFETAAIVAAGQGQAEQGRSYEEKTTVSQCELPTML